MFKRKILSRFTIQFDILNDFYECLHKQNAENKCYTIPIDSVSLLENVGVCVYVPL